MRESVFKGRVTKRLDQEFPGCVIINNDPRDIQGLPDLLILFGDRWAMLEVKASEEASTRPNQPHYVEMFGRMSYSSFIYPQNEDRVFHELQHAFYNRRSARVSQS